MDPRTADRITALLLDAESREGDPRPIDLLFPIVYDELRRMARDLLRRERGDFTLSPTEVVHEAWLRLADTSRVTERGRAYFFAAAAQAIRRIVVDHARKRGRLKRGGGRVSITLDDEMAVTDGGQVDLLELEDGLRQLALVADRPARVVECRYFAGLRVAETAMALGVTTRTVARDWAFARAWLYDHLTSPSGGATP